jgi:hypothetical protein
MMNFGKFLLKKMIREGLDVPPERHAEVIDECNEAAEKNQIFIIEKGGQEIGFFTFFEIRDKIFFNNGVIYKEFRDRFNLLSIRKFFREMYPGRRLYWYSKKRNKKLCIVK